MIIWDVAKAYRAAWVDGAFGIHICTEAIAGDNLCRLITSTSPWLEFAGVRFLLFTFGPVQNRWLLKGVLVHADGL